MCEQFPRNNNTVSYQKTDRFVPTNTFKHRRIEKSSDRQFLFFRGSARRRMYSVKDFGVAYRIIIYNFETNRKPLVSINLRSVVF